MAYFSKSHHHRFISCNVLTVLASDSVVTRRDRTPSRCHSYVIPRRGHVIRRDSQIWQATLNLFTSLQLAAGPATTANGRSTQS